MNRPLLLPPSGLGDSILNLNSLGPMAAKTKEKILVVDDDKNVRKLICQILILEDYEVAEASDGIE